VAAYLHIANARLLDEEAHLTPARISTVAATRFAAKVASCHILRTIWRCGIRWLQLCIGAYAYGADTPDIRACSADAGGGLRDGTLGWLNKTIGDGNGNSDG